MGIIAKLKNVTTKSAHPKDPVVSDWWNRSGLSSSGVYVTPESAMRVIAVYACVRIIAESVAMLPLHLFRKRKSKGRIVSEQATNIPLYHVLHVKPNRWQTSFEWREMMTGHVALRGNAYSEIISAPAKPVSELIPLHPDHVRPFRAPDKSIAYYYQPVDDKPRVILASEMMHLRGLSSDGITGMDPVRQAAEALGITIASETFGATFFGNGTVIGGVLEHPGSLSDKAFERLKKEWNDKHQGAGMAHKPAILEEGLKWQALGVEPEKAQFLETRKFQILEIARMFRIPPHMLADLERATFSNIEHQGIQFVTHTLMPWLVRWEQVIQRDLMTSSTARNVYPKFNVSSLLRGDTKTRYESYKTAAGGPAPWMSRNDIRELEDLNPVDGLDEILTPLNMGGNNESTKKMKAMVNLTATRLARKEAKAITRYYERTQDIEKFFDDVDKFYTSFINEVAEQLLIPGNQALEYIENSKRLIIDCDENDTDHLFSTWETRRAADLVQLALGDDDAKAMVYDTEQR